MCGKEALLGESALCNFQDMQRHVRPGSYDADLAAMTRQEVADGFAEGVFSARELDQMFGGAGWRALERFVHVQCYVYNELHFHRANATAGNTQA